MVISSIKNAAYEGTYLALQATQGAVTIMAGGTAIVGTVASAITMNDAMNATTGPDMDARRASYTKDLKPWYTAQPISGRVYEFLTNFPDDLKTRPPEWTAEQKQAWYANMQILAPCVFVATVMTQIFLGKVASGLKHVEKKYFESLTTATHNSTPKAPLPSAPAQPKKPPVAVAAAPINDLDLQFSYVRPTQRTFEGG